MGAVRVLPGYRVFKDNGDVATDATAAFYLAGTTTPLTVYSDKDLSSPLGTSVSASVNGVFPDIFVSDAVSAKVIISATGYTTDTIDYLTVATSGATTFDATISPTVNDGAALGTASLGWSDLFLASGAVINWNAGDVTLTHASNVLTFAGAASGYKFDAAILPNASDGAALGSTSLMFSDLFLASGAVVNFNNGDVLITHAANTLAFSGASSGYTFDAAPLPSANDGAALVASGTAWSDLFLASGAVVNFAAGDVTITHASNALAFAGASSGYTVDAVLSPATNDGAALGTTSLGWSDLHLATGAVINVANGLITVTHDATADALEVAGGAFRARSPRSTQTGGTLDATSSNKVVVLATAPTIDGNVHAADDQILLYNNTGSPMTVTQGSTGSPTQRKSGTSTTGNLTLAARGRAAVYFVSATEWIVGGDVT